jgi:predicted molibdopterin-dependent oxidoreductase YjgC
MYRRLREVPETVAMTVDGVNVTAMPGESVAAVLLRTAPEYCRLTPIGGVPRAPFCLMGACFDCLMTIDGRASQRSCMTPVRDGMIVTRQAGARALS